MTDTAVLVNTIWQPRSAKGTQANEGMLFGGSSKEGIMAGTPEGLAEFGQWSNSTMEYYYSGPPRTIHLSWIDI
jgi:hypothetical protein